MSTEQTAAGDKPATKDTKKTAETREYIVLTRMSGSEAYDRTGETGENAVAAWLDALPADEQGGPFVTIAMRNWQPTEYALDEIPATIVRRRK